MALEIEMSNEDLNEILASVSGDTTPIPPKASPKVTEPASSELDELDSALAEIDALPERSDDEVETPSDDDLEAIIGKESAAPAVTTPVTASEEDVLAELEEEAPSGDKEEDISQVPEPVATSHAPEPTPEPAPEATPEAPKVSGVVYYIDAERLKRDLAINPTNIDDALMTHASNYVHYAVQASNARRQYDKTKAAFEILESRLDHRHRETLKVENPKTTEAQIRAAVVSDPVWSQGNTRLIETRAIYELAQDAKEAYMMRRDTLLQLAKDAREERLGQLRVTAMDSAKDRVMNKLRDAADVATA